MTSTIERASEYISQKAIAEVVVGAIHNQRTAKDFAKHASGLGAQFTFGNGYGSEPFTRFDGSCFVSQMSFSDGNIRSLDS